jgi:hypothetical protein
MPESFECGGGFLLGDIPSQPFEEAVSGASGGYAEEVGIDVLIDRPESREVVRS